MPKSTQSVCITEQDREKFPDLFLSKKQLFIDTKMKDGRSVRSKLKSLKQSFLEQKVQKEKEMIKQRWEFEELLQKYEKFRKPGEDLPHHLAHQGRRSMVMVSCPNLNFRSSLAQSENNDETEVRLPISNNKFEQMSVYSRNKASPRKIAPIDKELATTSAGDVSTGPVKGLKHRRSK